MASRRLSALLRLPILRHLRAVQFRRLRPFGNGRRQGTTVLEYYWARYLDAHRADFRGRGLEIGSTHTLRHYGSAALIQAEALDLAAHSPEVTRVADLSRADGLPADTYDCFVVPYTLHVIFDLDAALYHSIRLLKPGGVLLLQFPCLYYYLARGLDMGTGAPMYCHWAFTPIQVENLLRRAGLSGDDYHLAIYGNLFAQMAFQMNLPAEQLTRRELEEFDPGFPLVICARAVKPAHWLADRPAYRDPWLPDLPPAQWNPVTGHYDYP